MRYTKILLFLLVATIQAFAAWTGGTSEPKTRIVHDTTWYVITSSDELAWFAAQVNDGNTAINAVLDNDIIFGDTMTSYTAHP